MIIAKPSMCTKLPVWFPKYNTDGESWEVWVLVSKIKYASPVVIIEFTKAKHLKGQRFCIRRTDIEKCPIGTNGKADVYKIPFDTLEGYDTAAEVRDLSFEATEGMDGIWKNRT